MSTEAQLPGSARRLVRPMPPTGRADRQKSYGTMAWFVAYPDLAGALDVIDGLPETVVIGGASVTRNIPLQHPWFSNLYAVGYDYEAGGWENGNHYGFRIHVQFETPDYPYTGQEPFVKISAQPSGRTSMVAAAGAAFTSGTPGRDVAVIVPGMSYSMTVFDATNITAAVESAWASAQQSVNAGPFRGIAAGRVLYEGPAFEYTWKRDGTAVCTYTHKFNVSAEPWNSEYKRDGTLANMTVGGSDRYPSLDFASLFY